MKVTISLDEWLLYDLNRTKTGEPEVEVPDAVVAEYQELLQKLSEFIDYLEKKRYEAFELREANNPPPPTRTQHLMSQQRITPEQREIWRSHQVTAMKKWMDKYAERIFLLDPNTITVQQPVDTIQIDEIEEDE